MPSAIAISPLAPPEGFPKLPHVAGVRFASAAAGIKYTDRDDVMLAVVDTDAVISGAFTKSATRSSSVIDCQEKLSAATSPGPLAILVNAGNANAFTGSNGADAVQRICGDVENVTGIPSSRVFTASTGVIGELLPDHRIRETLTDLVNTLDPGQADAAAKATMTTDTFPKGAFEVLQTPNGPATIVGFAKGSGMIAPDMATMLVHIFTDAKIDQVRLQSLVSDICDRTFNAITVDSDTSTSDSLFVVASCAGPDVSGPAEAGFAEALESVMRNLAHQVVRDGEGATKFIEISVAGATSDASAKKVGLSIANSPLVKTACAGEDPNWGRIVMAVGKAGEPADRDRLGIWFGDIRVAEAGWVARDYREEDGAAYMKQSELRLRVDLGIGSGQSTVWTCDLSHQYISINADYRS